MTPSDGPIRLADTPPFRLGTLAFDPATRQMHDGAATRTLEPRVMQVIALLAAAQGRVVGRQELFERCWGGRVVGEQAINRVMAIVRKIAAEAGDPFFVETVTKVGYRLAVNPEALAPAEDEPATLDRPAPHAPHAPHAPTGTGTVSRRGLIAAAVGGGVALGALTVVGLGHRSESDDLPPAARTFVDKGFDELDQMLPGYGAQSIAHFRRATEIAPGSAQAWGALALGYALGNSFEDAASTRAAVQWTRSAAQRALELDRTSGDARVALLVVQPDFRRWRSYEAQCRALRSDFPNHPFLLRASGECLCDVGRWRDAIRVHERWALREPDRLSPRLALALEHWQLGQLPQAQAALDELARQWPSHRLVLSVRLNFLILTGRSDQAERMAADMQDQSREPPLLPPEIAVAAARAIEADDRRAKAVVARDIIAVRAERRIAISPAIAFLATLGAVDAAFDVLGDHLFGGSLPWAAPFRPRWPVQRATDLLFGYAMAPLRADPRFLRVTEALGLEDYWRSTGTRPDYRA